MRKLLFFFCLLATGLVVFAFNSGDEVSSPKRSYGKGGDMVEQYYDDALKANATLRKLNDGYEDLMSETNKILESWSSYTYRSNQYYAAAGNRIANIREEATRKKLSDALAASKKKYEDRVTPKQQLITQLETQKNALQEQMNALKVFVTIPVAEQQQQTQLPELQNIQELIQKQDGLIRQFKAQIP